MLSHFIAVSSGDSSLKGTIVCVRACVLMHVILRASACEWKWGSNNLKQQGSESLVIVDITTSKRHIQRLCE